MSSTPSAVQSAPSTLSKSARLPTKNSLRLCRPILTQFPSSSSGSSSDPTSPQFSKLLGTVLGSPFLTTSELPGNELIDGTLSVVPRTHTVTRPTSPAPTIDYDTFSMINPPSPTQSQLEMMDVFGSTTPNRSFLSSPARPMSSSPGFVPLNGSLYYTPPRTQFKSLLPRLWDALSSPARKGKGKYRRSGYEYDASGELQPLDGEEGELIDDEACFIDVRAVTGVDIISLLPPELALHLLSFLELPSILACLGVCRTWRSLASDNSVWRGLFEKQGGWNINLQRAGRSGPFGVGKCKERERAVSLISNLDGSVARLGHAIEEWGRRRLNSQSTYGHGAVEEWGRRRLTSQSTNISGASACRLSALSSRLATWSPDPSVSGFEAPLMLDWRMLFKERMGLDNRWINGEPKLTKISGHSDSVYCLEFDSSRIITGSRDRSIKVWSLYSGRLLATFRGHGGSVLCLKFDKDWDIKQKQDNSVAEEEESQPGFMVSGSSDCSICVWDLHSAKGGRSGDGKEEEITADLKAVLRGHTGGVLDLRIDERWIVSCSKDVLIRVWDRSTLALHTTFRGHEGPVNAVGLQSGRVVSASGDGKMMLWDIESGKRLRVFEGHDRGLACIEYKDDLIVSGSNDCKIKLWSASTGECLLTLAGHDLLVRALSFDPRTGRLVSASYDKSVKVWDLGTEKKREGRLVREFRNCHVSHIFDVKFDVGRIVSTSHDQKIVVLDFTQGLDTSLFT